MNQIKEGLFEVEEQMPCSPEAIAVCHYVLPSTLDGVEPEEAAARIISFSQQLNQWVGVSWRWMSSEYCMVYGLFRLVGYSVDTKTASGLACIDSCK